MQRRSIFLTGTLAVATACIAIAAASWQKEDPGQWTSEDVYQILNNSPWSKSVSVTVTRGSGYDSEAPAGSGNGGTWGEGVPGGGMGRGGWGGGGMGRGMGRGRGGSQNRQGPTVTVQWASALPVRLAEAKMSGSSAVDANATKPLNEYVIAVTGLPKSGFAGASSGSSNDDTDDAAIADHLKVITVLSIGHERLNPTKVELNQGRDGRAIFHFDKEEPATLEAKDAEFRITSDRMELRKKFALKDMEYQGKLEL